MEIPVATLSGQRHKPVAPAAETTQALHKTAQDFEAAVLAELLRAAGAGQAQAAFGGGIGEDHFASFLLDAQATRMAASGGIGLAEIVLRGLLAPDSAKGPGS